MGVSQVSCGAGELSGPWGWIAAASLALRSLGTALLPMVGFTSPALELSLLTSPLNVELSRTGADHDPSAHDMPVKLLS